MLHLKQKTLMNYTFLRTPLLPYIDMILKQTVG